MPAKLKLQQLDFFLPCGKYNNSQQLLLLLSLILRRALRLHSIMTNKAPGYLKKMINVRKKRGGGEGGGGHCHHWMKGLCLISSDRSVPVVFCQNFPAFHRLGGLVWLLLPINLSGRYTSIHTQQQENEGRIIISVGHSDIYLPKGSVTFLSGAASAKPVRTRFLFRSGYYGVSPRRTRAL